MTAAIRGSGRHTAVYQEFNNTLPAAVVSKWQSNVDKWQADFKHQPDPYEEPITSTYTLFYFRNFITIYIYI